MQEEFELVAVASLVNLVDSKETAETGGVIVALASRTDIMSLNDIKGKTVSSKVFFTLLIGGCIIIYIVKLQLAGLECCAWLVLVCVLPQCESISKKSSPEVFQGCNLTVWINWFCKACILCSGFRW